MTSIIKRRLDYFNKTRDWTIFDGIPNDEAVNYLYPEYPPGYRVEEVKNATDPRLK